MKTLYEEAKSIFGHNILLLSNLVHCYAIMRMEKEAENIFEHAVQEGQKIPNSMFTSMIRAYYRSGSIEKAFDLYGDRYVHLNFEDDILINTMINICASVHNAEKAKQLWGKMRSKGNSTVFFMSVCMFINISYTSHMILKTC